MATIPRALSQVKCQLDRFVTTEDVEDLCRQSGHPFRRGKQGGPAGYVHQMLLQLLAAVSLAGVRHVSKVPVSKQAVQQSRSRLPLEVWRRLVDRVLPQGPCLSCWHGLKVMLVDAMSFLTEDTPELANKYRKAKNGKPSCDQGRPNPKLLAMLDLAGGSIFRVLVLPWNRQERICLARLLKACGRAALLLGDRGMVGFAQVALMRHRAVECCLRLPRWLVVFGRGKANHRLVKRLGKQDLLVCWRKGSRPKWLSKFSWARLPQELVLRQVSFRITRKGFRTHWAWVITTLTDPTLYPAEELVELYGKRWQVEVCFRDLKRTLGLNKTAARSVAGVQKELLAFVVLYNLVREVMAKAAERQKVGADRISFIDAARWLLWSAAGEELIDLVINPSRRRRTQPRMLKHARRKYARLSKHRNLLTRPPSEAKL